MQGYGVRFKTVVQINAQFSNFCVAVFLFFIVVLVVPPFAAAQEASSENTEVPAFGSSDASNKENIGTQDWNLHMQATGIWQGYPSFHGTNGPQSLNSQAQNKETFSTTLYAGVRMPWSTSEMSTELYVDPEFNQGYGLSHVLGVAGFPNGEAQKAGEPYPILNWARYFVRQTFGFGGEQENVESDANQLAGMKDVSRLTISVGKMSIPDFFDNNSYSHDSRTQFMNWALMDAGAYDYVADQKGYTDGFVTDLNQKDWAIRYGYFFAPIDPNSRFLDENFSGQGGHNLELEQRYAIENQPGVFRVLGFANFANVGSYRDALATPDLDIAATRKERVKYGYVLNIEQAITDDLGLFARYSWNDGQEEISSYTDIDQSFSLGTSLKGTKWDRPDDAVGLAGVINGLSQAQIDFLKAGGTGILIGDGSLNYAPEEIIETYYSYSLMKSLSTTVDYQFINNPAYNQSRGPVNVFAIRAHLEF